MHSSYGQRLTQFRSDDFMSEADSEAFQMTGRNRRKRRGGPGTAGPHHGRTASKRGRGGGKLHVGRKEQGNKKGPRKPLEPNLEFKALQSQATMAFIGNDYEAAEELALKAINFNPEVFAAHSLLSEIHMARGDRDKAVTALFNGAHTIPGDAQVWLTVAHLILERQVGERYCRMQDAIYCLSRAIIVQQDNVNARCKRASLNRESGHYGRAANEYEQLLKYLPHDTAILRHLADIYVEMGEIDRAVQRFDESFAYHQSNEPTATTCISWSDVNIYAELYGHQDQYDKGITKIKSLSRWLLGRKDHELWERFTEDDREWDDGDHPRRIEVAGFSPGKFQACTYGVGLPLELRVKLGLYRLHLGHREEALVSALL